MPFLFHYLLCYICNIIRSCGLELSLKSILTTILPAHFNCSKPSSLSAQTTVNIPTAPLHSIEPSLNPFSILLYGISRNKSIHPPVSNYSKAKSIFNFAYFSCGLYISNMLEMMSPSVPCPSKLFDVSLSSPLAC